MGESADQSTKSILPLSFKILFISKTKFSLSSTSADSTTIHDVLTEGVSVSMTGERWDGDGSDYGTWGLDVTREWSKDLRASAGSSYALFKNDFLLGQERQDVRTYYLKLKYRTEPRLTWTFGLEHETGDVDDFDTLMVNATWRF